MQLLQASAVKTFETTFLPICLCLPTFQEVANLQLMYRASVKHRDRSIHIDRDRSIHIDRESMLICLYLCLLDEFKLDFVYYRFNISWIRKTVLKTKYFCPFLKCPSLASTQSVQFIEGFFDHAISMCILKSLWCEAI